MKKHIIFLSLFLLSACSSLDTQVVIKRQNEGASSEQIETSFDAFFSGNVQFETIQRDLYSGEEISIHDEVSSKKKVTVVKRGEKILSQKFIVSQNGVAVEQYLNLANQIKTRTISENSELFTKTYANPFTNVIGEKKLFDYFTLEDGQASKLLRINDFGRIVLEQAFENFFPFYENTYVFDPLTKKEKIIDLTVSLAEDGKPTSLEFTKSYEDRYGAILVAYSSELSSVETVSSLAKQVFSGTAEQRTALQTSLDNLYTQMQAGNFVQTVNMATNYYPTYHNYYNFAPASNAGAMISDLAFKSSYGLTYIGMAVNQQGQYYMAGVSPDADYSGAASNATYASFDEILPLYQKISPDFFTYDETQGTYTFDIGSFVYNDYMFSFSILDAIFGQGDPLAQKMGAYLASSSSYSFNFHTLTIKIDEETSLPIFTLEFTPYFSATPITSTVTFSDFGAVNLYADAKLGTAFRILIGE